MDRANISRLSGCRKWLIGAFIDPVAVGRFSGRLPDADMVRRSHDKTEGSKEIGSLEQSTTLAPLAGKKVHKTVKFTRRPIALA